jgi:hypothetical protein
MTTSEGIAKLSILKTVVVLFLPETLAGRLTVLGFIFGIITAMLPSSFWLDGWTGVIAIALWVWAFVAAFKNTSNETRMTARFIRVSAAAAVVAITYLALRELTRFLGLIAASGGGKINFSLVSSSSPGPLGVLESCLVIAVALLLVWVPQVFFRIQLDINGTKDAQHVLLLLITAASSAATGIILIMAHFGGGPLRTINTGVLVVGVIGVMFLIAPLYRSLAKVFWQRGIAGVFSLVTLKQQWRNTIKELEEAHNRTTKRK